MATANLAIDIPSKAAARADPVAFAARASHGKWKRAKHLDFIGDRILDLETGKALPRLVVSCPPRHGKSWFISRFVPAWYLGRHPDHSVVLVTFQEGFSRKWGRLARDAFTENAEELWGVTTPRRSSTAVWEVYRGSTRTEGMMQAIGAGGAITGKGANLMIIDDLIKDLAEAQNASLRERQWEWFLSAVETRLEPPGYVIIISTRWHHNDLIGRLQKLQQDGELGDEYKFINLPALAGDDDPMGRKPGEALWPAKYNEAWLERKKKNVGPIVWNSLYQGRPTALKGNVFQTDWFGKYEPGPRMIRVPGRGMIDVKTLIKFGTVDLAASKKKKADYTAVGAWGYSDKHHCMVLNDVLHDRLSPNEIIPKLQQFQKVNDLSVLYVERVQGWLQEKFGDIITDMTRAGLPVIEVPVVGDKLARAISASGSLAAGKIFVRERAAWLGTLMDELVAFTGSDDDHDDQVDMLTMAVAIFNEMEAQGRPQESARRPSIEVPGEAWDLGYEGDW